jgi:hypothetical protein
MQLGLQRCAFLEVVKYKICVRTQVHCSISATDLEGRLHELVTFEIHR